MNNRKLQQYIIILSLLVCVGLTTTLTVATTVYGQEGTAAPAATALAVPLPTTTPVVPTDAIQASILEQNGDLVIGSAPMYVMTLVFDPDKKLAGAPGGGMIITMEDSPIPLQLFLSASVVQEGGSMSPIYANTILDLSGLSEEHEQILMAVQFTSDGVKRTFINVKRSGLDEMFISPEYVVFPNEIRTMSGNGPFVTLVFDPAAGVSGNLVVLRNGEEIGRAEVPSNETITFQLDQTRNQNDVLEWRLEDSSGSVAYEGIFGFPMSGASPDLVQYTILVGGS